MSGTIVDLEIKRQLASGIAHVNAGRLADAEVVFRQIAALQPDIALAHNGLGVALAGQARHREAIECYRRSIALAPNDFSARYNLGNSLRLQACYQEAIRMYDAALRIDPNASCVYNNLGVALQHIERHAEAVACFERALKGGAEEADFHYNLGISLTGIARYDDAQVAYRRAIALKPDHAAARWNYGFNLLLLGDYAAGWQEFEWRWQGCPDLIGKQRSFDQPQWKGEPLHGKTILLHAEQGMGDTLQFVRYAPLVAQRGARVLLECQAPLKPLLQGLPGVKAVLAQGEALPAFDLHCPLMSLPLAFGTRLDTIPARVPYLQPEAGRLQAWQKRMDGTNKLRVGLVWAGAPHYRHDSRRSIALEQLCAPLRNLSSVTFFSLQKGEAAEELRRKADDLSITDWGVHFNDFADTAAAIMQLDLVISVDTSVAHLAGALGKPVWLLCRHESEWRWLLEREDSPWYPGMRLFRQRRAADWDDVLQRLADALAALARA